MLTQFSESTFNSHSKQEVVVSTCSLWDAFFISQFKSDFNSIFNFKLQLFNNHLDSVKFSHSKQEVVVSNVVFWDAFFISQSSQDFTSIFVAPTFHQSFTLVKFSHSHFTLRIDLSHSGKLVRIYILSYILYHFL